MAVGFVFGVSLQNLLVGILGLWMGESKQKGDVGEAAILLDLLKRGYKVAKPIGEDWRCDLIILRDNNLEKVQVKYVKLKNGSIIIPNRSGNKLYSVKDVDWIAVYEPIDGKCYYIPSSVFGIKKGVLSIRVAKPKNNQNQNILWAKDFEKF